MGILNLFMCYISRSPDSAVHYCSTKLLVGVFLSACDLGVRFGNLVLAQCAKHLEQTPTDAEQACAYKMLLLSSGRAWYPLHTHLLRCK